MNDELILKIIRGLARKGFIIYTDHTAYERMTQRGITRNDIDETLINAVEIINRRENYIPKKDEYLTAYRVKGENTKFDIVVGIDFDDFLIVVTGFEAK